MTGREEQIEGFGVMLERLKATRPAGSIVVHGLRGVGKTVLLNRFEQIADEAGWLAATAEICSDTDLRALVPRLAQRMIRQLERKDERLRGRAAQMLRVLKSFTLAVGPGGGVEFRVDIEPEHGVADTGVLEDDLTDLLQELGEMAHEAGVGVVFLLDEMQLLGREELEAMVAALHRTSQRGLPVALVGAGLPSLPGLLAAAKSYAERLFDFQAIGRLEPSAARDALLLPAQQEGVEFDPGALEALLSLADGYPYFLQVWGKHVWDVTPASPITDDDVAEALTPAREELDGGFFHVRWDRATPTERRYLAAMASLGAGPYATGDVAKRMGYRRVGQTSVHRDRLIKKGLIYGREHGFVDFTVPHFGDFMSRVHPLAAE